MTIGFYQHGGAMKPEVAKALAGLGASPRVRNARYFNSRELEKFDLVVVDKGPNTDAITKAYQDAKVQVKSLDDFLGAKPAKPAKAEEQSDAGEAEGGEQGAEAGTGNKPEGKEFNPDATRKGGRKPKKQG